jgi:hypothetical protein
MRTQQRIIWEVMKIRVEIQGDYILDKSALTRYCALRSPLSTTSRRPRERKYMTLIAAFRTYEGVVICADSQETLSKPTPYGWGNYRCRVNKIERQDAGEYELVIGGAGNASLVDGFTDVFIDAVASWDGGLDEPTLKSKIQLEVSNYHRNIVALSTARERLLS